MADVMVDLELAPGLGLPYAPGAEASLGPVDAAAFAAAAAGTGVALSLVPSFDMPIEEICDFLASARQGGVEPPDLLAWYAVSCPEEVADAVAVALGALPFVVRVAVRVLAVPAGWEVVADPEAVRQFYLRSAPAGIDAFAAWQVPGGGGEHASVADMEHSWDLAHPDLAPAGITVLRPFAPVNTEHGTGCLGVVGARSTGAGLTGIVPRAALVASPSAGNDSHTAIALAARAVGRGGILLLELATPMSPAHGPDGPLELSPQVFIAIAAATTRGVLVVEPAGNGRINLDTDPRCGALRGFSPPGVDSGALLVAAGTRALDADGDPSGPAMAADFTSGGLRVNCFAPGVAVTVPGHGDVGDGLSTRFSGTSPASAIVAGVAAALQSVVVAAGRAPLTGLELRALLADPRHGHHPSVPSPANPVPIGVMPDLDKLIEAVGVPRLPPATAIRHGEGTVLLMRPRRGEIDQLDILEWREATGSWSWLRTTGSNQRVVANGHAVGLHARAQASGVAVDAVCPSHSGIVMHRPFRLDVGLGVDEPWRRVTEPTGLAQAFRLTTPLTAVASEGRLIVSGLAPDGTSRVLVAERQPASLEVFPMTPPTGFPGPHEPVFVTIDPFVRFNAPPVVYDVDGSVVLVGVDTTGVVWFTSWTLATGWAPLTSIVSGFDPAEAPALVHDGPALHVVGVDPYTGLLCETVRSADADGMFQWTARRAIAEPSLVTWGVPLKPAGPIAAATDGAGTLIAVGLTAAGLPVATERRPGQGWSPLFFVPTVTPFAPRAGVTLASPSAGVFLAFASDARGALHCARWTVLGWLPFAPV